MPSNVVQQLLEQGQRSGLFPAAAAQELIAQLAADEAPTRAKVAAQLIAKQVLTPYQAEQLLAGRAEECKVAGRYLILEKLGEGGMGTVYKAHDTQLDRDVALKVLRVHSLNDGDAIARFRREARALAKLSHPNIIQAYDNGVDRGRHFLVLEYVEGASLAAILRERGAIPPTLAADMIYQAALGMQHAHEKGLVHRDLKPANLLLSRGQPLAGPRPPAGKGPVRPPPELTTSYAASAALGEGIVKVLDLGLARFLLDQLGDSQVTKEGIGVGTPDYMAPEQFRDALHADARTDIYGLGCTLYQLISGTVPFPGSSFSEKAEAHAKAEPIPLEERCPEVPAGLAFVVSKMMAKHPAGRFQAAAEVAEALAPYVAGASHSMTLVRQTMRFHAGQLTTKAPDRRKRLLGWAGAVVAAACFVGLIVLAWPSIFPGRSGGSQNDSQSQTAGPATQASEPSEPEVVTIENGLTVAKDGTGEYTTIGDALAKVSRPNMTIRVLDDATYAEVLSVRNRSTQAGLILEAPKHATLALPATGTLNLTILNVPRVQIRGFRLRANRGGTFGIGVGGQSSGVTLEGLDFRAEDPNTYAVTVEGLSLGTGDDPLTIRGCTVSAYGTGVQFLGQLLATGKAYPCRGMLVHSCRFADCQRAFRFAGLLNDVDLVGNTLINCSVSGFEFEGPMPGSGRILIANNSVMSPHHGLVINDPLPDLPEVVIQNNLIVTERGPDMAFLGKDPKSYAGWLISHNWRQVRAPGQPGPEWILPPEDKVVREIRVLSRDPSHPDFLRPLPDSPLATGGAGGDLPTYVGALPPRGIEPWDWQKTWDARARKSGQQEGKTGKD